MRRRGGLSCLVVFIVFGCRSKDANDTSDAGTAATTEAAVTMTSSTAEASVGSTNAIATTRTDDGGEPTTSCCKAHAQPGCDEPVAQECVCLLDAVCCVAAWDSACVDVALGQCDPICNGGMPPTGTGTGTGTGTTGTATGTTSIATGTSTTADTVTGGDEETGTSAGTDSCCEAHASPGCNEPELESCVCASDSFCCSDAWDDLCVDIAGESCGATCERSYRPSPRSHRNFFSGNR